jgi:hypothetical protein
MKAKKIDGINHGTQSVPAHHLKRLKEQRLDELDRGYFRQLRRLRRVVWSAKSKRQTKTKQLSD